MATNHDVRDMEQRIRDERLVLAAERGLRAAKRLSGNRMSAQEQRELFAATRKAR